MFFQQFLCRLLRLHGTQLVSLLLKATDDVSHNPALWGVNKGTEKNGEFHKSTIYFATASTSDLGQLSNLKEAVPETNVHARSRT
jgi:hypothetical protein